MNDKYYNTRNRPVYGTDETAADTTEGVNLFYEGLANTGAASWTIGINNTSGQFMLYTSGWSTGNQYVTIMGKVGSCAETVSTALTGFGMAYNIIEANHGEQTWRQAVANITVAGTAWGIANFVEVKGAGWIGLALAGGYFVGGKIQEPVNEAVEESFQMFTDWYFGVDDPQLEPIFPAYIPPCSK